MSDGTEERSVESGVRIACDFGLDDEEAGGEALCAIMVVKSIK